MAVLTIFVDRFSKAQLALCMEVWNSPNIDGFVFFGGDHEGKAISNYQKFAFDDKEGVDHIMFRQKEEIVKKI